MTTEKEPLLLRAAEQLENSALFLAYMHNVEEYRAELRRTAAELRALHERMKDDQKPG